MSSAQDEFNSLVANNQEKSSTHPEDRDISDSDPDSDAETDNKHQNHDKYTHSDNNDDDDDDDDDDSDTMVSRRATTTTTTTSTTRGNGGKAKANYQIPNTIYDANTGPKGVIADAQAFERARKNSFRKTFGSVDFSVPDPSVSGSAPSRARKGGAAAGDVRLVNDKGNNITSRISPSRRMRGRGYEDDENEIEKEKEELEEADDDDDDDDDDFMRKWRQSRMQELQNRSTLQARSAGSGSAAVAAAGGGGGSGRGKTYGFVETVDAEGYLDAVEKSPADTVVVVCIYDPESHKSTIVEDSLSTISRRNPSTRFVKLHHEIAEMRHIQAPALLAYRAGDVFATVVDIFRSLPEGRFCSAESLEGLLRVNRVL